MGAVLALAGAFPVVRRIFEIPKRRQEREWQVCVKLQKEMQERNEKKINRDGKAIKTSTKLIRVLDVYFRSGDLILNASDRTTIMIFKHNLILAGVVPKTFASEGDSMWHRRLNDVLPYIIQHGVEQGVVQYDLDRQEEDDEGDDGA